MEDRNIGGDIFLSFIFLSAASCLHYPPVLLCAQNNHQH